MAKLGQYKHTLLNPKDDEIEEVFNFLEKYTEEGENDSLEVHSNALKGALEDGKPSGIPYFAELTRSAWTNELVQVLMWGLVPAEGGGVVMAITYCYTHPEHQRRGLGKINFETAKLRALQVADELGMPIVLITAEASSEARKFFEGVGLRRVYVRKGKKLIVQIKYTQAPIEEGGPAVLENLMVGFIDDNLSAKVQIERIIEGVHTIQMWSSEEDPYEDEFNAQFDGVDELLFLTVADVMRLRSKDIEVIETDEDEDDE